MELSVLNFRSVLQSLTFKTFYHNQTQQFDYDNLFLNKRVVVFSVPSIFGWMATRIFKDFQDSELPGIDMVYCVSCNNLLIGPWADKHSNRIIGLYADGIFANNIAQHYNINKSIANLKSYWQYIIIINNGIPEKIWHNPIKDTMPLSLVKNPKYAYHNLSVEKVKEYLATC